MEPTGYINFKGYDERIGLDEDKMSFLLNSFQELDPYLDNYYLAYYHCPKTSLKHIAIVFNFSKDKNINLNTISNETISRWKLENFRSVFEKHSNEFWRNGCIAHLGIPPIQCELPKEIVDYLMPDLSHTFHHEGDNFCFY